MGVPLTTNPTFKPFIFLRQSRYTYSTVISCPLIRLPPKMLPIIIVGFMFSYNRNWGTGPIRWLIYKAQVWHQRETSLHPIFLYSKLWKNVGANELFRKRMIFYYNFPVKISEFKISISSFYLDTTVTQNLKKDAHYSIQLIILFKTQQRSHFRLGRRF